MEFELDRTPLWPAHGESPHDRCVGNEVALRLARIVVRELTERQREVLIAVTIHDVPTGDLASRLHTTPGALYKTLHDARRKLKAKLADA